MLDTVIIGAGIAGLTSAIYASRKKMQFEIIGEITGGQMMESAEVLNYPGIIKTTGAGFSSIMEKQAKENNFTVKQEKVKEIKKSGKNFKVITEKNEYETRSVIVASGARPRKLGVPGEDKYKNNGVTYCSICDGPLFSGVDVAIVGGGNSALEAVDFLLKIAKKIYLINIGDKLIAHEYLQERIQNQKNVKIINSASTKEIIGDGKKVTALKYEQDGKEKEINVEGIFVEIGRVPNTDFAKKTLKLDKHNHILIDCTTHTSVEGIFAAGDCASGHEYQYIIAAGQGCMALLKTARYLASKKE